MSGIEERQRGEACSQYKWGGGARGLAHIFGSYTVVVIMPSDRPSISQHKDLADQGGTSPSIQKERYTQGFGTRFKPKNNDDILLLWHWTEICSCQKMCFINSDGKFMFFSSFRFDTKCE